MKSLLSFLLVFFISKHASAQVLIEVTGERGCGTLTELVLAREKNFLFHVQIPIGGNGEFKLLPGKYEINAATESKCLAIQKFDFDGKQRTVQVKLKIKSSRIPAQDAAGFSAPQSIMPWTSPWPMPWWYPYYNPWYSNMSFPCAWSFYGCAGPQYPRGGPIVLGKPNIYFRAPASTQMHVQLNSQTMDGLIASVPAHKEKGWQITTRENAVEFNGVMYPYLYYDLRVKGQKLQFAQGFCGGRDVLLEKMMALLKSNEFPEQAQADFKIHWSVHFPMGRNFCVLPQSAKEMDKEAPISFTEPVNFTRMVFVVLPEKVLPQEPQLPSVFNSYNVAKLTPWVPEYVIQNPPKVKAYEWGLAFAFPK